MSEIVLVFAILAIVAVLTGRSLYRTMTDRNGGCGCCNHCHGCLRKDIAKADPIRDTDE